MEEKVSELEDYLELEKQKFKTVSEDVSQQKQSIQKDKESYIEQLSTMQQENSSLRWLYFFISSFFYMLSFEREVINSLRCTDGIPPQYWWYSSTVLIISSHNEDLYPFSFEHLSQYCTDVVIRFISRVSLSTSSCLYVFCKLNLYWFLC